MYKPADPLSTMSFRTTSIHIEDRSDLEEFIFLQKLQIIFLSDSKRDLNPHLFALFHPERKNDPFLDLFPSPISQ